MKFVFIPTLPVRVEQVTGTVGGAASGPILSVTDNQIVIDSALPLEAAPLVRPGMEVAIDEPTLGIKTKGKVENSRRDPRYARGDGYHFYFSVRVGEVTMPLQGFSLRLTMPIKSTAGEVLAVSHQRVDADCRMASHASRCKRTVCWHTSKSNPALRPMVTWKSSRFKDRSSLASLSS